MGHVAEFRSDPLGLLGRFNREIGDAGRMSFGPTQMFVVNTPELVRELLVEHAPVSRKSRFIRAVLHPLVGQGLFTSEGPLWRRQRKLMAPLFHHTPVAGYARDMTDSALRCIGEWKNGGEIDVAREMTRITMSVASKTLFGVDTFDEADELGEALTTALGWSGRAATSTALALQLVFADGLEAAARRLPGWLGRPLDRAATALDAPILWPGRDTRELKRALALLDARVAKMIADRRAQPAGFADLLSRLLEARDDQGKAMDDRQLRDEILTLFVAGHETTATALSWAFYLLSREPRLRDALEHEAAALGGRTPTVADLPRLAVASRVFMEALRMYPPVPVYERQAMEPITLGGHRVAAGTYVGVFPWALHHRPEIFPEPERFDPDRFAEAPMRARHRYAWIPFGAGARICIGNHFALQEGPLVLACIAAQVRLERLDTAPVLPDPQAATLRPLGAIRMRVTAVAAGAAADGWCT